MRLMFRTSVEIEPRIERLISSEPQPTPSSPLDEPTRTEQVIQSKHGNDRLSESVMSDLPERRDGMMGRFKLRPEGASRVI